MDILDFWIKPEIFYRCDADPSALANYVVALVKKDKPEKELRALCADQLDVFLQKGISKKSSHLCVNKYATCMQLLVNSCPF